MSRWQILNVPVLTSVIYAPSLCQEACTKSSNPEKPEKLHIVSQLRRVYLFAIHTKPYALFKQRFISKNLSLMKFDSAEIFDDGQWNSV